MPAPAKPQTSLHDLLSQAYDLAAAIGAVMDAIKNNDGPQQPEEWHDLKVAFDASGVITGQLYQMVKRQRAADQPIPYILAENGVTTCTDPLHVCTVHPDGQHFMGVL